MNNTVVLSLWALFIFLDASERLFDYSDMFISELGRMDFVLAQILLPWLELLL